MGKCNLNHSVEDVQQKFNSQSQWLPEDIRSLFDEFLVRNPSQTTLNEMFDEADLKYDPDEASYDKVFVGKVDFRHYLFF